MKSILIVNNTKGRCKGCPLLEVLDYNEEECKCYMNGQDVTDVVAEDKYAYTCPLKPLPKIPPLYGLSFLYMESDEYCGYEQCLKDILGEEE